MIDAVALFEKYRGQFTETQHARHQHSRRHDISVLLKLDELVPGQGWIISSLWEHRMYLEPSIKDLNEAATEEDILYLIRSGVRYDEEVGSLFMDV